MAMVLLLSTYKLIMDIAWYLIFDLNFNKIKLKKKKKINKKEF